MELLISIAAAFVIAIISNCLATRQAKQREAVIDKKADEALAMGREAVEMGRESLALKRKEFEVDLSVRIAHTGSSPGGGIASQGFQVTNCGTHPVRITRARLLGRDGAEYAVKSMPTHFRVESRETKGFEFTGRILGARDDWTHVEFMVVPDGAVLCEIER